MLDLFLTERLYQRILQDPRYTHKFWSFYWRAALPYAVLFVAVLLFAAVSGVQEPFTLMLGIVILLMGAVLPAVQWIAHRRK